MRQLTEHNWQMVILSGPALKKTDLDLKSIVFKHNPDKSGLLFEVEFFTKDKDSALKAAAQDPEMLRLTSDELKGDREAVLAAVTKDGWVLDLASDELKGDKDIDQRRPA